VSALNRAQTNVELLWMPTSLQAQTGPTSVHGNEAVFCTFACLVLNDGMSEAAFEGMTQRARASAQLYFCTLFRYFRAKICSTRRTAVMQAMTMMPFKFSPGL